MIILPLFYRYIEGSIYYSIWLLLICVFTPESYEFIENMLNLGLFDVWSYST